ncbi:MAG TPA: right-handed parallel beta-helix repeat-containing protein [Burkholderiales bacterium]|nr:right-handed parallel beta-helix repeat-containing protein [Burkholderiales bacterium]
MKRLALLALFFCTGALADAPARAVPTFESLGIYFTPRADPGPRGCEVRFRESGEEKWREALPLWYDARDGECRGSIVHLSPGTLYEVDLGELRLKAKTWEEKLPVSEVVTLEKGQTKRPLEITKGGKPGAYVLYRAHPEGTAIDVEDRSPHNVVVSAPYVIVRGLVLKGAQKDAIDVRASDVVIEDNDISGWGRYRYTNSKDWKIGVDMDSGIRANCSRREKIQRVVIQGNRIHDPRYGANSWSWGHPAGPQGITFSHCGGNHVIRGNEIVSADPTRYFNDAIGGEDNFSREGFPNRDSDIYGNVIAGAWDDGIEAEGSNRNVRIWGNRIERTAVGIGTTVTHHGPLYVFGNTYRNGRKLSERAPQNDDRGPFLKAGSGDGVGGGRRYVFDNAAYDVGNGIAGNSRQPLTNTVSRNNVWMLFKPHWPAILEAGGSGNDFDYDRSNGRLAQRNAGKQVRLPNFSDRRSGGGDKDSFK